ncbi:MAG TPA: glycosyltransferase, partial [Phycisphaerales bacterium]|nr:glycosyltransferase [Phycisphaerales bacterium]
HRDECDGTYRRAHPMWGRAFAWALRRAAVVLAQNEDDARLLRRTVGASAQVIRNAHPLGPLEPQASRDIILWAGRSAGFKRPRRFLDLARRFPDERFVMICQRATGDERYETLQDEAEAVGNVQFIPRVPFHEVEAYFRRARVFVNTSDAEGFPNTFVQAAAAGVAILSYAVNPDGFLTAFSCGIDCGGHFDRMVQGLRFLLDQDRYVEIGLNARRYAEEHHDMAKGVEQYKALFRGLAGR